MRPQSLLLLAVFCFVFSACKKEPNGPVVPADSPPNYQRHAGEEKSAIRTADGNIVVLGYQSGYFLLKMNPQGQEIWRNTVNALPYELNALVETGPDFLISGTTLDNWSISRSDIFLMKTTQSGDTLWTRTYGGAYEDYAYEMIPTSDGNFLVCGITYPNAFGYPDIYLLKIDANGDTLWTRSYPDPDQEISFHVTELQNGDFLVTGTNEDNSQPRELYLLRVDAGGNQLWTSSIGPATWKWGAYTLELPSGDLLTCGKHSSSAGYTQVLVVKTDAQGNLVWEHEYGAPELSEEGTWIRANADGSFTITGRSYDVSTTSDNIVMLNIDAAGNQNWMKTFGESGSDFGHELFTGNNDGNIIIGGTNSFGTDEIFLLLMNVTGQFQ